MPILSIPGERALENRRVPLSLWPTRTQRADSLYPVAIPRFERSFTIDRSDKIFCIGSCFAREIEAVLHREGFDVLSRASAGGAGPSVTPPNVYSVPAIHQIVRAALGDDDASSHPAGVKMEMFSALSKSTVLMVTLGLSEAWFDRESNVYLNEMPAVRALRASPDRYELRVLDFPETVDFLAATLQGVSERLPACRILLTVSPVPLYCTFRSEDVFLSNAYSKSVLRTAVEHVRREFPHISYFPSYEMATLSDPRVVWGDGDYRHVDREFVSVIVSHAMASLAPSEASRFELKREESMRLLHAKLDAPNTQRGGARALEAAVLGRLLDPRKLRKYQRGRDAFFEDSGHPLAKAYGRLTRRRA